MLFELENSLFLIFTLVFMFFLSLFVGCLIASAKSKKSNQNLAVMQALLESKENIIGAKEREICFLRKAVIEVEKEKSSLEAQKNILDIQKQQLKESSKEISDSLELKFSSLADKILDEKTKKFDENSKKELINAINPLKDKIKDFQENLNQKYLTSSQEQASLKKEIQFIAERGKEMTASADSLSRALTGSAKAQGRWGEMVLEKILENAGLKNGAEFVTQSSYQNSEGSTLRPDVTIIFSDQRELFIDSKVSLTYYDKYIKADDDEGKCLALDELEKAFCLRIKELGEKKYHSLKGVTTLDFVIMFTPIESAFSLVAQSYEKSKGKNLFEFAWERGVIVTSPLTLMPILKTIKLCWNAEYQHKNSQSILQDAINLYGKFETFITKFNKVQDLIEKTQEVCGEAKKSLTGSRSLSKGFTKLADRLGIQKRCLPAEYEHFDDDDELKKFEFHTP